ncbi:hypothetical protein PACTADRAFT_74318 [Pachysolen tannophilus NRRL Y-2460]|uniref:Amino acid permease/ SLC12A domain-containing protein n=1 Tax=Pachysolen tannophilus NRRL Y-2460 TaxID=669874 RepID=A0A1E4TY73_PACTA|nr:hypothetical protein PACTADRAFT_74318 [Pachysolen tannophilus NRRL Y-2460]
MSAALADLKENKTQKGLEQRHIQLLALGGCIGTGLFVGSGSALSTCGPAALLISYMIMSFFVWSVMQQITEMVTWLPLPGRSTMSYLAARYCDDSLSFCVGWNYYYAFSMIAPAEVSAAAFVIQYWSSLNVAVWISIMLVLMLALNFAPVKYFGESEFWIATIKLFAVTGLIIVGIVIFFGGAPKSDGVLGFHYWKHPGAYVEHLADGNTGKFLACWTAIIKSGFSFVLSPELITTAIAESKNPRYSLPKASNRFIYRLMFFYIGGTLTIGVICASNDSRLMSAIDSGSSSAAASPFVIGIQNFGIPVLNHIINACILTSAFSCGNSFIYSSSRILYSMALEGKHAPRFFAKTNRHGVPYIAVIIGGGWISLAYLEVSDSSSVVFTWLSNIATISGFFGWIFSSIIYLRFRKAMIFHGTYDKNPFKANLQPYCAYLTLGFFSILALTNGYAVFIKGNWSTSDFFAAYVTVGFVFVLYFGHKLYTRNWKRWYIPVEEIDVFTGLDEVEAEAASYKRRDPKNIIEKFWFWLV